MKKKRRKKRMKRRNQLDVHDLVEEHQSQEGGVEPNKKQWKGMNANNED